MIALLIAIDDGYLTKIINNYKIVCETWSIMGGIGNKRLLSFKECNCNYDNEI